jgi:hypothetical protein
MAIVSSVLLPSLALESLMNSHNSLTAIFIQNYNKYTPFYQALLYPMKRGLGKICEEKKLQRIHSTPTRNGTKMAQKWHNLDLPLDCATFYEDRKFPSFPIVP